MELKFRNVLVVDDCKTIRNCLTKELSTLGYIVDSAADGVAAIQALEKKTYDFLITDCRMPNMDGELLCNCIRAKNTGRYLYIIMMTAHADTIDVATGLQAGADDFIFKPINLREIGARLLNGGRILALDRDLTSLATKDALTETLNRRTFVNTFSTQIELCRQRSQPLSCIMLDLDEFKQLNDTYGHVAGDHALIAVAEVLKNQFRYSDHVFRYGGEEFNVLLAGCDESGAAICAERCREDIEQLKFQSHPDISFTVSCGVAQINSYSVSPWDLTERADAALREAKKRGRNRVVRYSDLDVAKEKTPALVLDESKSNESSSAIV